ncbi:selenocysteine-specific translation elongation factor [Deferribacteraceae bacterium V6Fe1]|nr:selenocysteine-specific translation elongation factor [Deferribacteraceae bacterium V6Fe1]
MGKNVIIGTAGHIDHGKSSLVKALTGTDPDRLKEEKNRGITIDLGYAGFELDNHLISFIDVPGHESFVKNMIAGATSFDIGLIVVDAQEKIKAQTIEHTNIIKSIGIEQLIVAITKSDLLDSQSLDKNLSEIKNFFIPYNFKIIDFIPVSIFNCESLEKLKKIILKHAEIFESDNENRPFYYRIDRVFHKKGFGTIVTGSCLFGKISIGDELTLYPQNISVKVKNINVHGKEINIGKAHQRLALNVAGIEAGKIERGNILFAKDSYKPFKEYYCKITIFDKMDKEFILKTNKIYHVFIGTTHIDAKIILFGDKSVKNGESAFCKLVFQTEYPAFTGETFLIRGLEPATTVCAGKVIAPSLNVKNKIIQKALAKENTKDSIEHIFNNIDKGLYFYTKTQYFNFEVDNILKELKILSFDNLKIDAKLISKWLGILKNKLKQFDSIDISSVIPATYLENKNFLAVTKNLLETKVLNESFRINNLTIEKKTESPLESLASKVLQAMQKDITLSNKTLIAEKMHITLDDANNAIKILSNRDMVKKLADNVYIPKTTYDKFTEDAKKLAIKDGYVDIKNSKEIIDAPRKILIPLLDALDKHPDFIKKENKRYLKNRK